MPFDVAGWQSVPGENQEEKPEIDLFRPSLPALAHLLRNRHLWPKGFTWNYIRTDQCAIGLGQRVWGYRKFDPWKAALPESLQNNIFFRAGGNITLLDAGARHSKRVTPEHVATVIEYFANKVGPFQAVKSVGWWSKLWTLHVSRRLPNR